MSATRLTALRTHASASVHYIQQERAKEVNSAGGFHSRGARGVNEDSRIGLFDALNGGFTTGTTGLGLASFGRLKPVAAQDRMPCS